MIIYDPDDPHKEHYDVDDGELGWGRVELFDLVTEA